MFAALAARPIVNRVICSLRRRLSRLYYSTESSCPTACDAVLMRQLNSGGVRIANLDKIKCTFLAARSEGQRSRPGRRSEEHTSELQSLMRISYAVFCLKKKNKQPRTETAIT